MGPINYRIIMEKTEARIALEHYFAVRKETEEQKASGHLDNLHYQIKVTHHVRKLQEKNGLAALALDSAINMLGLHPALPYEKVKKLENLLRFDTTRYVKWLDALKSSSLERTAYRLLDVMESIEYPEIPEPSEAAMSRYTRAHSHQLERVLPDDSGKARAILLDFTEGTAKSGAIRALSKDLHVYNTPSNRIIGRKTDG